MEQRNDGDDSVANLFSGVAGDANNQSRGDDSVATTPVAEPTGDAGAANISLAAPTDDGDVTRQDVMAAIADKLTYSLTVEDAQEHFARARRKVPSGRSLQRY